MPDDPMPLTAEELVTVSHDGVKVRPARSQVFSVRLSASELRLLAREAREAGMTVGAFIKQSAVDAAETRRYASPKVEVAMPCGIMIQGTMTGLASTAGRRAKFQSSFTPTSA